MVMMINAAGERGPLRVGVSRSDSQHIYKVNKNPSFLAKAAFYAAGLAPGTVHTSLIQSVGRFYFLTSIPSYPRSRALPARLFDAC